MKIFITGSEGFLGKGIAETISSRGREVIGYDAKNGDSIFDDKAMAEKMKGCSAVIHLVAYPHRQSAETWEQFEKLNVGGTKAVLKAMKSAGVGYLIFCSTGNVYCFSDGINEKEPPILPTDTPKPEECHPYPRSKLIAEQYLKKNSGDIKVVVFRPNHIAPTPPDIYNLWKCATITKERIRRTFANAVEVAPRKSFEIFDLIEPHENFPTSLDCAKRFGLV